MSSPEVSIVMLGWGLYEEYTKPAIDSILSKTENVDYELIVVDNGSTDGTGEKLAAYSKKDSRLVPILLTHNLGFSGGNNKGFAKARGKFVIFINNDIIVLNSLWLKRFVDAKKLNPNVIYGGKLVKGNMWTEWRGRCTDYLEGWCVFGAKEDFDKLPGPWDEDFGKGFFEDGWLSVSFKLLGYTLEYIDPGVEHFGSKTVSRLKDIEEMTKTAQKVWENKLASLEKKDKLRIVIVFNCPDNDFNDSSYEGRGVGGSEATLICLTRELVKKGHLVEVYNDTTNEGMYNGVYWYNLVHLDVDIFADIFILYRNYHPSVTNMYCGTRIFFSHDQWTSPNWETDIFPLIDRMFCVSPYHKSYILNHYSIKSNKIDIMYNGLNGYDYEKIPEKVPGKMVFCSVPKRGLDYILKWFPEIKRQVPNASLWITADYTLWGGKDPDNAVQRQTADEMRAYGIHYLGRVPRSVMVEHQLTSELMPYTCNYDENFCISALECMAAGAVPVTSDIGSMKFTVGEGGIVIGYHPEHENYKGDYIKAVVGLLTNKEKLEEYRKAGMERAHGFDWRTLVDVYEQKFYALRKEIPMNTCNLCSKQFKTAFELFKHRAREHPAPVREAIEIEKETMYKIETSMPVMVSIGMERWEGKTLTVPYIYASEVIRILTDAYGPGIVLSNKADI